MKKLLSVILVVCMLFSLASITALATDECQHNWETVDYGYDCTKGSYEVLECTLCEVQVTSYLQLDGEIIGHKVYKEWKEETPATETEKGTQVMVCQNCGETLATREIPATGKPAFVIGEAVVGCREDFSVDLSVENNCGFSKATLYVVYFHYEHSSYGVFFDEVTFEGEFTEMGSYTVLSGDEEQAFLDGLQIETEYDEAELKESLDVLRIDLDTKGNGDCTENGVVATLSFGGFSFFTTGEFTLGIAEDSTALNAENETVDFQYINGNIIVPADILCNHVAGEKEITREPTTTEKGRYVINCTLCGRLLETGYVDVIQEDTSDAFYNENRCLGWYLDKEDILSDEDMWPVFEDVESRWGNVFYGRYSSDYCRFESLFYDESLIHSYTEEITVSISSIPYVTDPEIYTAEPHVLSYEMMEEILGEFITFNFGEEDESYKEKLSATMLPYSENQLCSVQISLPIINENRSLSRLEAQAYEQKLFYGILQKIEKYNAENGANVFISHYTDLLGPWPQECYPGDVNYDFKLSAMDMLALKKYIIGTGRIHTELADINGDGRIGALDVLRLKKALAGM